MNYRKMKKLPVKRLLEVLCFIFCLSIFLQQQNVSIYQGDLVSEVKPPKITMGFVSCRRGNNMSSNSETFVLIKSVLISSMLNGVSEIDFHIFLEHEEDSYSFRDILKVYRIPFKRVHFWCCIPVLEQNLPNCFFRYVAFLMTGLKLTCTFIQPYSMFPNLSAKRWYIIKGFDVGLQDCTFQ